MIRKLIRYVVLNWHYPDNTYLQLVNCNYPQLNGLFIVSWGYIGLANYVCSFDYMK